MSRNLVKPFSMSAPSWIPIWPPLRMRLFYTGHPWTIGVLRAAPTYLQHFLNVSGPWIRNEMVTGKRIGRMWTFFTILLTHLKMYNFLIFQTCHGKSEYILNGIIEWTRNVHIVNISYMLLPDRSMDDFGYEGRHPWGNCTPNPVFIEQTSNVAIIGLKSNCIAAPLSCFLFLQYGCFIMK